MNKDYYSAILLLFGKWLNKQECYSIKTIDPYLRITSYFLRYLESFSIFNLKDTDKDWLKKFVFANKTKQYAQSYINLRLSALDLFYAWAQKNKYCYSNPVRDLRKEKLNTKPFPKNRLKNTSPVITILTENEQKALLEVSFGNELAAIRNRSIVALTLAGALYAEEIITLPFAALDLKSGCIDISSGKPRKINLGLQLCKKPCMDWLLVRNKILQSRGEVKQQLLFFNDKVRPLTKRYLHSIVSSMLSKAGINKESMGPDILRQTAICNMFKNGLTIEDIQQNTGIMTLANIGKYRGVCDVT